MILILRNQKLGGKSYEADNIKKRGVVIISRNYESIIQGLREAIEDTQGKHQLRRDVVETQENSKRPNEQQHNDDLAEK